MPRDPRRKRPAPAFRTAVPAAALPADGTLPPARHAGRDARRDGTLRQ